MYPVSYVMFFISKGRDIFLFGSIAGLQDGKGRRSICFLVSGEQWDIITDDTIPMFTPPHIESSAYFDSVTHTHTVPLPFHERFPTIYKSIISQLDLRIIIIIIIMNF